MRAQYKILLSFAFAVLFNLAFASPLNPPAGNWYQQFMPDLHGAVIVDIKFTDSLTGFAVTNLDSSNSAYILKTTNGGDNWIINLTDNRAFTRLAFINSNTGFVTRGFVAGNNMIYKTSNGGNNWSDINMPEVGIANDISVLNEDTIWVADNAALDGGIFRTTDGGLSWIRQFTGGGVNPTRIYMYNWKIGFMVFQSNLLYKTTTSGENWFPVPGGGFMDIYFIDSLTGWKADPTPPASMKKTTDGGLNWVSQTLPSGGIILTSNIARFCVLNRDTVWGAGGQVYYGSGRYRGMLYRTINGGDNWLFQIPDTSFSILAFGHIKFLNKNTGWALGSTQGIPRLIHTTDGGDTTFFLGLKQVSSEVPKEFKLYQNYPNPFNPITIINYELRITSYVRLIVFDVNGKEIVTLVNQKQSPGEYNIEFDGSDLSSGVYFYRMQITNEKGGEVYRETKKAILLK